MHEFPLITTIAAAFTAAWIFGMIAHRLRLSPIVGYLLAGIAIGPFTPGFVGDPHLAPQLAEIGVILLMFGVGLHFRLKDLLAVRNLAIPGAIAQSTVATLLGIALACAMGMPFKAGLVLGISTAVASTVVLIRGLNDNKLLNTTGGHVAVGWTIVEDLFTVIFLILIPALGSGAGHSQNSSHAPLWLALLIAVGKLAALVVLLLVVGSRLIPWLMVHVARLRSRELFTLTVLVISIAIAAGSSYLFGASMALGAFLAGMVVGQSPVSHQAAADALPLRDAFAVLFFASVGMLFDPRFVIHQPLLVVAGLAIIMVGKPIATLLIVAIIGYPLRVGLTVALALAQIGELSFILAEAGHRQGLINDSAHHLIIAGAIISIVINPFLFGLIHPIEQMIRKSPRIWRILNRRAVHREGLLNAPADAMLDARADSVAVVIGYGPTGKTVDDILRSEGLKTVIVDLNMDTVRALTAEGRAAIYGDAFNLEVMHRALAAATHIIITLADSTNRTPLIAAAKLINPFVKVFVRARYIAEKEELHRVGADGVCFEEVEGAVALAKLVMMDRGHDADRLREESLRIRRRLYAHHGIQSRIPGDFATAPALL